LIISYDTVMIMITQESMMLHRGNTNRVHLIWKICLSGLYVSAMEKSFSTGPPNAWRWQYWC